MRFPLRHGGFGFISTVRISEAAYFASQIQILQNGALTGKFGERVQRLLSPIYGNLMGEHEDGTIQHDISSAWKVLRERYGSTFTNLFLPTHHEPEDVKKVESLECLYSPSEVHPNGLGSASLYEKMQREISHAIHRYEYSSLMQCDDTPDALKARMREATLPGGSSFALMVPSSSDTTIPSDDFITFLCHKYELPNPFLSLERVSSGIVGRSCPLHSAQTGSNCGQYLCDAHMRHCKYVLNGPVKIHDAIAKWLTKLLANVCGSAVAELRNDIDGTGKRPYDALGAPGLVKKRAHDVVIVDGTAPTNVKATAKNPLTKLRMHEQKKRDNFKQYADRAHSVTVDEFAPFAITAVGSVGEEANSTLRMLATAAIPGPIKDPTTRMRRAMWLSARRKELMSVLVRNLHFTVTTKHRMIIKALSEERGTTGPEKLLDPHVIPEDVGIFGAIDEDGNDLVSK